MPPRQAKAAEILLGVAHNDAWRQVAAVIVLALLVEHRRVGVLSFGFGLFFAFLVRPSSLGRRHRFLLHRMPIV
eukprot:231068-Prymnesium_polylepis.2